MMLRVTWWFVVFEFCLFINPVLLFFLISLCDSAQCCHVYDLVNALGLVLQVMGFGALGAGVLFGHVLFLALYFMHLVPKRVWHNFVLFGIVCVLL